MTARLRMTGVLLALTALTAACSTSTAGHTPPRSSGASTTGAVSSSPAATNASSTPAVEASAGAADWTKHLNAATLPHPDMDCARAGLGGKVDVLKVVSADVTGDGRPEAIVRLECAHSASEWPDSVYVYADTSGGPTEIGLLLRQNQDRYAPSITTKGNTVTLGLVGWSKYAPGCCPDLNYTQTFTWGGRGFDVGPLRSVVKPCGESAFAVSAADPEGATGHSSIVLEFKNRLPQTCTIGGYPGLDAMTASGAILAHAARTLNGFTGGAHSLATLTVAPGKTVSARVEWMNFNPKTSGPCATSASIEVTPANTSDTAPLSVKVTVCGLQVHPTVAGTSGNA
jgi:hypothetical protein